MVPILWLPNLAGAINSHNYGVPGQLHSFALGWLAKPRLSRRDAFKIIINIIIITTIPSTFYTLLSRIRDQTPLYTLTIFNEPSG